MRTIKDNIAELTKSLDNNEEIYLPKGEVGGGRVAMMAVNRHLEAYTRALDTGVDVAVHSVVLVDVLTSVMCQLAVLNNDLSEAAYQSRLAMKRESLFSPRDAYQLKEDLETVSLLHTKHKLETERLIEEGQIAIRRNAELKIKVMELEAAV